MSTSTVTAFAGAAIGFMVAGPGGAQWGFMAGSLVGSLIDPQKISGPRLTDLTVQSATEGAPIPLAFGAVRIAGNVLQCSPKRERSHSSRAGKGGPKSTTYTYDVDIAVGLCVGPILGVSRIWANGALIYDTRPSANASTLLASGKIAAGIKIYLGDEAQMPDPTLEALSGVGKTPAYRGQAYVVFNALQLEKFGNSVPNFTFEVVASGIAVPYRRLTAATIPQQWRTNSIPGLGFPTIYSADDVVRVGVAGGVGGTTYLYDLEGNYIGSEPRITSESQWPIAEYSLGGGAWAEGVGRTWDGQPLYMLYPYRRILGSGALLYVQAASGIAIPADGGLPAGRQLVACCMSADGRYLFSATAAAGSSSVASQWHITEWTDSSASLVKQGSIDAGISITENTFGPGNTAKYFSAGMMESNLEYVWESYGAGGGNVTVYQIGADNVLRVVKTFDQNSHSEGLVPYAFTHPSIFAELGVAVTITGNGLCVHTRLPALSGASASLSSIVSALCARAGLQAGDIDVTQLTDTVTGYVVAQQGTARAAVEPLRQFRPFDVVEDAGKLIFVPRGGAQAAVIPWDDLAAHDGGSTPDPLTITAADETELPTVATIVYNDPAADYQIASQSSRRNRLSTSGQLWPIAPGNNVARIELPIGMSAAQASRAVDVLLWDAFTARKTVDFAIGLKYAGLRPTDPIQILGPTATYNLRITKIEEQGLLRKMSAVFEDSALYQSAPPAGVTAGVQAQTVALDGPTRLALMDIPLLRDTDDGPGYYVAMSGYLAGWPGATLYASADSGATWAEVETVANAAVMGMAQTALGSWTGGNVVDESNTVTVQVTAGQELSSITLLGLLNGGNAAVLGNELIHFRDATLIAANTYKLAGLLRGRKGTEDAVSGHAVGDRFVLLEGVAGLARIAGSLSDIGVSRLYKPVTGGASLDDASSQSWANTGRGLKPLSPVLIGAGRDAGGGIVISWTRRTRTGGEWRDGADASLGEAAEAYEIDILDPTTSTVRRTLKSSTPSCSYALAQQAADFGGMVSSLSVRVYQISSSVGRGMPGAASITLPAPAAGSGLSPGGITLYSPVIVAGSTPIAEVSGTISGVATTRYFSSADGGATWSQIGSDTPAPAIATPWPKRFQASLSSGLWAGFQGTTRWNGLNQPNWYAGGASTKPAYTGAQLLGGRWPHALASDGTTLICLAEGNRIYTSTDAATWTDRGQLSGDIGAIVEPDLSGTRLKAQARLLRGSGCWLLELYNVDGDVHAIYRTTDAYAVSGWIKVLDLAAGYSTLEAPGYLDKAGSKWITLTHGYIAGVYNSIIWTSSDEGLTWSSVTLSGQTWSGVYTTALDGPYYVGTTTLYFEQSAARGIRNTGSGWSAFAATGIPAFDVTGNIISTGSALIARSNTGAGLATWTSSNGTSWAAATGITTT